MPKGTILTSRTLRATPSATGEPVADAQAGDVVETFEIQDEFIKVQLVNVPGKPTGWISKAAVGAAGAINTTIDKELFARACWRESLFFGVNAHYLAGVAELRSRITSNVLENQVGPFGLLPAEWAADWKTENLSIDKFPADTISNWRMQCKMFALMTRSTEEAYEKANDNKRPSAADLYLAQVIGVAALKDLKADPNKTVAAVLSGFAADLPPGNASADDLIKRHVKLLRMDVANPTAGVFTAHVIAGLSAAFASTASFVIGTGASVLEDASATVVPGGPGGLNLDSKKIPAGRKPMAQKIVAAFADAGFGKIQQAAALANAIEESHLNPAAASPVTPNEESFGLFQLNRRGGGLGTGFSQAQLTDPDFNIKIIINEVLKFPDFGKASTLLDAVTSFVMNVEKPADKKGAITARLATGETLLA